MSTNAPTPDENALMDAIKINESQRVKDLLQQRSTSINLNRCIIEEGKMVPTPLSIACKVASTDIVSTLLQYGADPNVNFAKEMTILHLACHDGYHEKVKLLLKYKANVNFQTVSGFTPLHVICQGTVDHDRFICIQLLLEHGADVNITYKAVLTPLLTVVNLGSGEYHLAAIRLLMKYKGDVNAPIFSNCIRSDTILHLTVRDKEFDVIHTILECSTVTPNLWILNDKYRTVWDIARTRGDTRIIECLQTKTRQIYYLFLKEKWVRTKQTEVVGTTTEEKLMIPNCCYYHGHDQNKKRGKEGGERVASSTVSCPRCFENKIKEMFASTISSLRSIVDETFDRLKEIIVQRQQQSLMVASRPITSEYVSYGNYARNYDQTRRKLTNDYALTTNIQRTTAITPVAAASTKRKATSLPYENTMNNKNQTKNKSRNKTNKKRNIDGSSNGTKKL